MSKREFVHLHTHSEFSILDGASRINDIVKKTTEFGMPAAAITDHGVMYGNITFYSAAKAAGLFPILGCEVYVAARTRHDRDPKLDREQYHLVLLAENEHGYKNLIKLVSTAFSEGMYYKPRVDKELLAQYSEGLIATSACLGGELPARVMRDPANLDRSLAEYLDIFGKENFYIELQDHGIPEQKPVNEALIVLARKNGINLVAANDSHYNTRADAEAHDALLCIQTGTTLDDPKRMRFGSDQFYIKSPDEMYEVFGDVPDALQNTLAVAERCRYKFDFDTSKLPNPGIPEEYPASEFMELQAREGLARKMGGSIPPEYEKQLEYECGIINGCGFPMYMLIVKDFTDFARREGICVGVRGSAAGSIVCYGLGITDVDPIDYGLTFERFLNPERVEMPDVDLDIQDDRREDLIQYVVQKYGRDRVGQIATFGSMKARGAVRDCGRVLGMDLSFVDKVSKMIPTMPVGITIDMALNDNPDFSNLYKNDSEAKKLINMAKTLEGLNRSVGIHAAGVLISEDPLTDHVPVQQGSKGEFVAQLAKKDIAKIGLLKMDFLGLANLTILNEAVALVKRTQGIDIDMLDLDLENQKTFEMLGRGDTSGVFQLESPGMRRNVIELQPNSVREMAAIVALYRPGPMAYIPKFVKSKFGQEPIKYLHPDLEPILRETYGVICYQDQVLRIACAIAGFSLGQADILRKAMSSKNRDVMEQKKDEFVAGAVKKGVAQAVAVKIYEQVEPFAGYAFNKAHAVCYAFVAYRTAYMKANYPVEYYCALLSANMDDKEKLALYMDDCRRLGVKVLPPDVNYSFLRFEVEDNNIRFGLGAIKGCGRAVTEGIVAAREAGGQFTDLVDFCRRTMDQVTVNKSTVEAFIKVGAFTSLHENRAQLLDMLPDALNVAACEKKNQSAGQGGLFDDDEDDSMCSIEIGNYSHVCEYNQDQVLAFEKDLAGIYLSGHPLENMREILQSRCSANAENFRDLEKDQECCIGGMITDLKLRTTKRGDKMASFRIEDLYGTIPVTVFPHAFKSCADQIAPEKVVLVKGKASHREKMSGSEDEDAAVEVEILVESVTPLNNGSNGLDRTVSNRSLYIKINGSPEVRLDLVKNLFDAYPGDSAVYFCLVHNNNLQKIRTSYRVDPSNRFISEIEAIIGRDKIKLQ